MKELTITEVLLSYGEDALVVLAKDNQESVYIGLNYDDTEYGTSCFFYFAQISLQNLEQVYEHRIDVKDLLTAYRIGEFLEGESSGNVGDRIQVEPMQNFHWSLLPNTGMFLPRPRDKHEP